MKKYFWDYGFLLLISGTIVILDQWTKWLVEARLPNPGEYWSPWLWLAPYARIVHWTNTGAAFGMFQDLNIVFTILAIIVSIAILYYFPQVPRAEWPLRLAMALQLGGAVGNLVDRLDQGHVTDFISVMDFAVFNVADASITIGVVVLIVGVWYREQAQKKIQAKQAGEEAPGTSENRVAAPDPVPEERQVE